MNLVRSADNMDDVIFETHMNKRHAESLGGLEELDLNHCSDYAILCWRRFHNSLHRIRPDIEHEHGAYRPEGEVIDQHKG